MATNFKLYKNIIIVVSGATIILLIVLTFDSINETGDWKLFDIDFKENDNIVSAYGSLIGGILSFLSILFVFFSILEQREQILNEKKEQQKDSEKDLLERLKLLNNFLASAISNIESQGKRMKKFYEAEKLAPSSMNTMYFSTNKSFGRLLDMDNLSLFKSFQSYLQFIPEWEKTFLNTYNNIDFYFEAFKELREKYQNHINDKVTQQKKIGYDLYKMVNLSTKLLNAYLINNNPKNYLSFPWSYWANEFIPIYYDYLKDCERDGKMPDFRYISNNLLGPYIEKAMIIRRDYGFDSYSMDIVDEIINIASYNRKKIREVEDYSLQYADDIEKNYNEYFSVDNKNIEELKNIKNIISQTIESQNAII